MKLATEYLGLELRSPLVASASPLSMSLDGVCRMAGADALELNIHRVATDPGVEGATVEREVLDVVRAVRASTDLPLAIKIGPQFSSVAAMARACTEAGAEGLVLFNRFYQPAIDIDALDVVPRVELSRPGDGRVALRWIAILYGRVVADFAATTGIHSGHDALEAIAAGATVAMTCSALIKHGIEHIATIEREMVEWLKEHEYDRLDILRGSMSQR